MTVCSFLQTYSGQWQQDIRQGLGIAHRDDGLIYNGSWIDDIPQGNGKLLYQVNGSISYNGDVWNWTRHGYGVFYSESWSGEWSQFSGVWKMDKRNGQGKLARCDEPPCNYEDDLEVTIGIWENDVFVEEEEEKEEEEAEEAEETEEIEETEETEETEGGGVEGARLVPRGEGEEGSRVNQMRFRQ